MYGCSQSLTHVLLNIQVAFHALEKGHANSQAFEEAVSSLYLTGSPWHYR